jgi:CRISPR-associated protein Cas6
MTTLDLAFQVLGGTPVPVDHSYLLYSAISRLVPEVHSENGVAIHPLRGVQVGNRSMTLQPWSRLTLRLEAERIPSVLALSGKKLRIGGEANITVGVPEIRGLVPATMLRSRIVTIKGFQEPGPFAEGVRRQLDALGLSREVRLDVGKRRTVRIKDKEIVGFEVILSILNGEESIKVQEAGVGGRRHLGCGIFVPVGG